MSAIDIVIIVVVVIIVLALVIYFVRKKMKGESLTCECHKMKGSDLVKKYHKKYKKKNNNVNSSSCPYCSSNSDTQNESSTHSYSCSNDVEESISTNIKSSN